MKISITDDNGVVFVVHHLDRLAAAYLHNTIVLPGDPRVDEPASRLRNQAQASEDAENAYTDLVTVLKNEATNS